MIKCYVCKNHQQIRNKHICTKCETKTVYGAIQEKFIEGCSFFEMTELEKKRVAYYEKIRRIPKVKE